MSKILNSFIDYLNKTPPDQIKKDWEEVKNMRFEGPTVEEFFSNNKF